MSSETAATGVLSSEVNISKLSNEEREIRMWQKIRSGESIESLEEMSDDYFQSLINLMLQQADSELAGAFGYVPWIMQAPTTEEKLAVADIVKDEVSHARAMYRLLENLGIDVDSHVAKYDYAFRVDVNSDDLKNNRAADDRRVNIFYYPINTWVDFIVFQFCMVRGAGHQLEDVRKSTYGPWKREIERIFKEGMMHIGHDDCWMKKMALDKTTKSEVQAALNRWYLRTMNIFGQPKSRRNETYRKYGLKRRDNDDVRKAFSDEIRLKCSELGLKLPEWKPEWKRIGEDGVVPG